MEIRFEITKIKFSINNNKSNYFTLNMGLQLVHYYLSPEIKNTDRQFLYTHFNDMKEYDDSHITITTTGDSSKFNFSTNGKPLHIEIEMSSQKLVMLYEEIKNKSKLKKSTLTITLTEEETEYFPTKEDFENDNTVFINFKNFKFELVHNE